MDVEAGRTGLCEGSRYAKADGGDRDDKRRREMVYCNQQAVSRTPGQKQSLIDEHQGPCHAPDGLASITTDSQRDGHGGTHVSLAPQAAGEEREKSAIEKESKDAAAAAVNRKPAVCGQGLA